LFITAKPRIDSVAPDVAFQNLALVIHGAPEIDHLAIEEDVHFHQGAIANGGIHACG